MFDFTSYDEDQFIEENQSHLITQIVDDHPNQDSAFWQYNTDDSGIHLALCDHRIKSSQRLEKYHYYEVRYSDYSDMIPVSIEQAVGVNFYGTIISDQPLDLGDDGYINISKSSSIEHVKQAIADYMQKETANKQVKAYYEDPKTKDKIVSVLTSYVFEKEYIMEDTPQEILNYLEDQYLDDVLLLMS